MKGINRSFTLRALFISICLVPVILCTSINLAGQTGDDTRSYLDRAKELYKQGPSKAQEIIELLEKELEINPDNAEAAFYIAITNYGIGEHERAVEYFNLTNALYHDAGTFKPKIFMLKARSLCALGDFVEAWHTISPLGAFFIDNEETQNEFDCFLRSILDTLNTISMAKAFDFIDQRMDFIPDKYSIIIIDHSNLHSYQKDSNFAAFFITDYEPIYSTYWCHVLLAPTETVNKPLYCAYYVSDSIMAFVEISNYKKFKELAYNKQANVVKQLLEKFD